MSIEGCTRKYGIVGCGGVCAGMGCGRVGVIEVSGGWIALGGNVVERKKKGETGEHRALKHTKSADNECQQEGKDERC